MWHCRCLPKPARIVSRYLVNHRCPGGLMPMPGMKRPLAVDSQRFNVSRTDWDSAFPNAAAVTKITTTGALPDYWNPSPPTVNTAIADRIPWLATLTDTGGTSVAKQVAANLIDYCDTNDIATNDFTAMGASATYVGLEEVPYINEVVITAGLTTVIGPPASSTLTLTANCELVQYLRHGAYRQCAGGGGLHLSLAGPTRDRVCNNRRSRFLSAPMVMRKRVSLPSLIPSPQASPP